jgi:5-methyltetrahydrofolate--homocysteine methyltransferase
VEPLSIRLASGAVLLVDGATGTMLQERGLEPGTAPESFTLSHPEVLEEVARLYVVAGADMVETNTFGASPMRLEPYGLAHRAEELNREAVVAVRRAVAGKAYVAGSVGPSGRMLTPHGDTEPPDVYENFKAQMQWLADAGVDCVCVETMLDLTEATSAVRAAKEVSPETPVTATMTFDETPRGFFTVMGVSVEAAAAGLADAGADAIGSNCGNGIEVMVRIAEEFRRVSDLPIIIQPNAGLPEFEDGKAVYSETPEFTADRARRLIAAGVSIIGGCCGTTPDHTRAVREVVNEYQGAT